MWWEPYSLYHSCLILDDVEDGVDLMPDGQCAVFQQQDNYNAHLAISKLICNAPVISKLGIYKSWCQGPLVAAEATTLMGYY